MKKPINIVWFKRDLSVYDNAALFNASKSTKILPIYILEPELWHQPDMSYRHYLFLMESLHDLDRELKRIGANLVIRVGNAVEVLNDLLSTYEVHQLWSHQETWNKWTYDRDVQVRCWAQSNGIEWLEPPRNGVIRRLEDRSGWAKRWQLKMSGDLVPTPESITTVYLDNHIIPNAQELGLDTTQSKSIQRATRKEALVVLNSFFKERGLNYTREMSSPERAEYCCSRISAYLAFGQLSIREVFQAAEMVKDQVGSSDRLLSTSLKSFSSRLRWHCHFIQKLEDEPRIESKTLHSSFESLRQDLCDHKILEAWKNGNTGFPMVDACMRYLNATGWLNFRMRAMLVSFASYHLWLDWRLTATHLARQFLDYEPGIHYSQMQMQSGTTGMNSIRIYNPIKQGMDQDPNGKFIRKWVPELKKVPNQFIHQPWLLKDGNKNYPKPIVDEKLARKAAQEKVYSLKKQVKNSVETASIIQKHASRLTRRPRKNFRPKSPVEKQLSLDL